MERFKACEKEMKTKAYSKEGLTSARLDPRDKERQEVISFINSMLEELERQIETLEVEQEGLQGTVKKHRKDTAKAERISEIEESLERHKWHCDKLEMILKMLENGSLSPETVVNIQEDIKYYVESNQDADFAADDEIYDEFNLHEDEDNLAANPTTTEFREDGTSLEELAGTYPETAGVSAAAVASAAAAQANHTSSATGGDAPSSSSSSTQVPNTALSSSSAAAQTDTNLSSTSSSQANPKKPIPPASGSQARIVSGHVKQAPSDSASNQKSRSTQSPLVANAVVTVPHGLSPLPPPAPTPRVHSPQNNADNNSNAGSATNSHTENSNHSDNGHNDNTNSNNINNINNSISNSTSTSAASAEPVSTSVAPDIVAGSSKPPAAKGASAPVTIAAPSSSPTNSSDVTNSSKPSLSSTPGTPVATWSELAKASSNTNAAARNEPSQPADKPVKIGYTLPPGLQDLISSFDAARKRISTPPPISSIARLLENSYLDGPDSFASDRPRLYHPESPFPTPAYYPQTPRTSLNDPRIMAKMDVDTLFYIFYYRQGTYQQYLAAKELKDRSWRFHKRFLTWFQRHEEPKVITNEYEVGTYRFFDFEGLWLQRRKSNFKFEYQYLEDEI